MIPNLYDRFTYVGTTTQPVWSDLLIGRLRDAISCIETSSVNSEWELVMEYPMYGHHASDIQVMRIIYTTQPFFIYRIAKQASAHTLLVYARHINYLLSFVPVWPFKDSLCTPSRFITAFNTISTPFRITSEITTSKSIDLYNQNVTPSTVRDFMMNDQYGMIGWYGGEWVFDGFDCTLKTSKGTTTDKTIRYGKDLIDARQEESIENLITHIIPYAYLSEPIKATVQLTDTQKVQWTYKYSTYTLYEIGTEYPKRYSTVTNTPHLYAFTNNTSEAESGTVALDAYRAGSAYIYALPGAQNLPFRHVAAVNILDDASNVSQLIALNWQRTETIGSAVHLISGGVNDDGTGDHRTSYTAYNYEQSLSATGMTVYYGRLRTMAQNYVDSHPVTFPVDITVHSLPEFMEGVKLGDTIRVRFDDYGINTTAEITTMEYNVLQDRIESYTIGNGRTSFADTMLHQDNKIERLDGLVTAKNPLKGT